MAHKKSLRIAVIAATTLIAGAIVDKRFDPGNPALRLFKGRSGTVRTDQPGQAVFDITNAGGSEAVWSFFEEPNRRVRLAP